MNNKINNESIYIYLFISWNETKGEGSKQGPEWIETHQEEPGPESRFLTLQRPTHSEWNCAQIAIRDPHRNIDGLETL